jgi:hypothetical protein
LDDREESGENEYIYIYIYAARGEPIVTLQCKSGEKIPWYSSITKEPPPEYNWLFSNPPVEPLTIKQNTPEWFLLCAFSCSLNGLP